ncbi:MAG: RHS repeat-associated core domain-containing protein, partial [Clostridia bacterium]|nr:RHS repeat-associated core domain-containing protein [Clostridia bacterium]
LLMQIGDYSLTYDAIGNPVSMLEYGINGYQFDWEGRELIKLKAVDDESTTEIAAYTYNADGIRTSKTVNGVLHEYILNGSRILAEKVGDAVYVYMYDETGAPVGLRYRTSSYEEYVFDTYLFEKNLQGDIIAIYNTDGVKIGSYKYDAYGAATITVHSSAYSFIVNSNPFRYRGYYYDTESGYYYLQTRYYNPTWGRFINADSALYSHLLGYNMFAYCYNNPANYYDPYGESATEVLAWWLTTGGAVAVAEPTPIGEVVYFVGLLVFGSIVAVEAVIIGEQLAENIRDAVDPAPEEGGDADDQSLPPDSESLEPKEGDPPRSLPVDGEPNSDQELYDEKGLKQKRHYGPDGKAEYDIDYRHSNGDNSHDFPHKHVWDWNNPKNPRGPSIPFIEIYP